MSESNVIGQLLHFPPRPIVRDPDPWITRAEVAARLGVSVRWVDYRVTEGMPSLKMRGARRFKMREVEDWLRQRGTAA